MKHIWIICLLVVCSCNTVKEDFAVNEDYEKLFQFSGARVAAFCRLHRLSALYRSGRL